MSDLSDFNGHQALRMSKHALTCKYESAGGVVRSYRLQQEIRSKKITKIPQIKCAGCGYSLDIVEPLMINTG